MKGKSAKEIKKVSMQDISKSIIRQNKNKYFDEALLLMKTTFFQYFFGVVFLFSLLCLFVFSLKTIFILVFGMVATLVAEIIILYKVLNLNLVSTNKSESGDGEEKIKNIEKEKEKIISNLNTKEKDLKTITRGQNSEAKLSDVKKSLFQDTDKDNMNDPGELTFNTPPGRDPNDFENANMDADEDQGNDVKIKYKSLIKKSPGKGVKDSPLKANKYFSLKNENLQYVNHLTLDQSYYCKCKFSADNFENILKLKTDNISNIIDGARIIFITNFSSLRYFKDLVLRFIEENDLEDFKHTNFTEKGDLLKQGIATLQRYFSTKDETETTELHDANRNAKFYQNHLLNIYKNKFFKAVNIFEAIAKKFAESYEVVSDVIVENMKNLTVESNSDMEKVLQEMGELLRDVTDKELILQESTEKYFTQKKVIQHLNESYTKSKLKLKKFDEVAKLEMDIKVANNLLNEIQAEFSYAVDEYQISSTKFTKNSIQIYKNMMKVISRDFEVTKAMFIFYFETIKDAFEFAEKIYKKEKDYFIKTENTPNEKSHFPSVDAFLNINFDKLSISEINKKVETFCENLNNDYDSSTYEISNNLQSTQNYTTLINYFKNFIPFINNYKNLFSKMLNVSNFSKDLKQTAYNVIFKYLETMENETKSYFMDQTNKINDFSKEMSQDELRIHEISKLIKDKFNAFNKKHSNFEKDVSMYKNELKNTIDKNKYKTTLNNFISLVKTSIVKERSDLQSIFIVFNEYFNLIINVLDLLLNKTLKIYFDFDGIPASFLEKIIEYLYNIQQPSSNLEPLENEKDMANFENDIQVINTEISEFLSLNNIKLKLIHEKNCYMYEEDYLETHDSVKTPKHTNTYDKIKDFVVQTFKMKSYSKSELIKKIDAIEQEKNEVLDKINKNYNEMSNNYEVNMMEPENIYKKAEVASWFNGLLKAFFWAWKDNDIFNTFCQRELFHVYNRKRPENLDIIHIKNFQFLYDIDLSYRGEIKFTISTSILINVPFFERFIKVSLLADVIVHSINGVVRLYFNGNKGASSWYAFLGEPLINFDVNLTVGEDTKIEISLPTLKAFVKEMLKKKFRKYALPNKRSVYIPLTREVTLVTLETVLEEQREKERKEKENRENEKKNNIRPTSKLSNTTKLFESPVKRVLRENEQNMANFSLNKESSRSNKSIKKVLEQKYESANINADKTKKE